MGLYISLKRRVKDEDINRFRSAFSILDILFKSIKIRNRSIVFYKDYPVPELNEDFKRVEFNFGLLESSFRKRIKEYGMRAGFEIEADLILEDIEKFYPKFREYLLQRILHYNNEESKKDKNLFLIRRALISDHKKEFHSIDEWSFFYSKEPEEFINNLSYGNKEIRERLLYANRDKFAEFLKNLNQFVIKMHDYAEQCHILIKDGSIAIIPKDKDSMGEFVRKMREKVGLSIKEVYPNEKDLERKIKTIFSN